MNNRETRLAAKVKATNRANEAANALYAQLAPIFTPLVGQKIIKADGTFLAKIEATLPSFPCETGLHIFRRISAYSLGWAVKTAEANGEYTVCYAEQTVYVGVLNGSVLESITPPTPFRTDYTTEEVARNRAAYAAAQKIADEAKSALYPFGEYDN